MPSLISSLSSLGLKKTSTLTIFIITPLWTFPYAPRPSSSINVTRWGGVSWWRRWTISHFADLRNICWICCKSDLNSLVSSRARLKKIYNSLGSLWQIEFHRHCQSYLILLSHNKMLLKNPHLPLVEFAFFFLHLAIRIVKDTSRIKITTQLLTIPAMATLESSVPLPLPSFVIGVWPNRANWYFILILLQRKITYLVIIGGRIKVKKRNKTISLHCFWQSLRHVLKIGEGKTWNVQNCVGSSSRLGKE